MGSQQLIILHDLLFDLLPKEVASRSETIVASGRRQSQHRKGAQKLEKHEHCGVYVKKDGYSQVR